MEARKTAIPGILAFAFLLTIPGAALAQQKPAAEAAPKWGPHIDFEAKPGTKRSLGEADLFLPLMQDPRTLVFANLRGRFDDDNSREGNLGLGARRMLEGGWNIGGYGYFDRRRSTTGNYFNQVTLGAEALGRDWDFRGNVYLPQGDRVRDLGTTTTGGGAATAAIVGTTVQVTTPGSTMFSSQETALKGYDLEAGWRAPVWAAEADKQLRFYAGGYHFSDNGIRVSGPRVRAELTIAELPALWKGAQLILGAEYQDDNARGGQGFVSARLRIPLDSDKSAGVRMNWQERRMAAPVVRDVDVVTQTRSTPVSSMPAVVETATQTAGGQAITVLNSGTTTGAALPGAVAGAGANSVVLLSGTFSTTATINVQTGQTVMGAGMLSVTTPSGRTVTLTTPAATITGTINATGALSMGNASTASGLVISNTGTGGGGLGVLVNNTTGVTIANNTISAAETGGNNAAAIAVVTGSATITGNTLSAASTLSNTAALFTNNATVTVIGNTFSALQNGVPAPRALNLQNSSTINPGSIGNVLVTGGCFFSLSVTGSIGLAGGATCP